MRDVLDKSNCLIELYQVSHIHHQRVQKWHYKWVHRIYVDLIMIN
jgi:hypothetical protein